MVKKVLNVRKHTLLKKYFLISDKFEIKLEIFHKKKYSFYGRRK